jgi:hypothetical protein
MFLTNELILDVIVLAAGWGSALYLMSTSKLGDTGEIFCPSEEKGCLDSVGVQDDQRRKKTIPVKILPKVPSCSKKPRALGGKVK